MRTKYRECKDNERIFFKNDVCIKGKGVINYDDTGDETDLQKNSKRIKLHQQKN